MATTLLRRLVTTTATVRTMATTTKKALVLVAHGSEEMETVITVDVLRRGGINVTLAGVEGAGPVECSRGVKIVPDRALSDVDFENERFDAVVLPGGAKGAHTFAQSELVHRVIAKQYAQGETLAAICAAPIALQAAGVAKGKHVTSHPSVQAQLSDYQYSEQRVVIDGHLVTSRGPGTSFEFALSLVERLQGAAKRDEVIKPMMMAGSA